MEKIPTKTCNHKRNRTKEILDPLHEKYGSEVFKNLDKIMSALEHALRTHNDGVYNQLLSIMLSDHLRDYNIMTEVREYKLSIKDWSDEQEIKYKNTFERPIDFEQNCNVNLKHLSKFKEYFETLHYQPVVFQSLHGWKYNWQ